MATPLSEIKQPTELEDFEAFSLEFAGEDGKMYDLWDVTYARESKGSQYKGKPIERDNADRLAALTAKYRELEPLGLSPFED